MLLPLKPICDLKKSRRDGTSLIFIQYCYSAQNRTLLNTGIGIPAKYWTTKNLSIAKTLPEEYGNAERLNEQLCSLIRKAEDLVKLADKNNVGDKGGFVKQAFAAYTDGKAIEQDTAFIQAYATPKASQSTFFAQIDDYIKSKERKVSEASITIIRSLKRYLQNYEAYMNKEISFGSIDYPFYESFIDYLTFEHVHKRRNELVVGLKVNTIGKILKKLRSFIKDRIRRKIVAPIDLSEFLIPEEETDAIYLTYDEIAAIYATDLAEYPHLLEYRNLFVLACLTGLRYSDFSVLRPEDLRNNMLYKKQDKSDNWVVIPMRAEAKDIFTEQFKSAMLKLTNAEFNRHIKIIGQLAGITMPITFSYKKGNKTIVSTKEKCNWITTHTARRSFCTNEFLAGTPVKLIMQISGHKNERDFYRYIRISPEEGARKVAQLWSERSNMVAFPVATAE